MMNPFRTGRLVRFQVIYDQDWHTVDLFFYIFLGVLGVSAMMALSLIDKS